MEERNYLKNFHQERLNLREIHFIKSTKTEIEEKCSKVVQQYDFSKDGNIQGWIEQQQRKYILYIASPDVIYFPVDSSGLFGVLEQAKFNLRYIEKIEFSNINTSYVTDMSYMFCGLKNLTKLDLTMFDTSNVTNMSDMFYECSRLQQIALSSFDTKKVTSMSEMFMECTSLQKLDLSNFDTSEVLDFDLAFSYMKNLEELKLSNFKLNLNVCTTYRMFIANKQLKTLDITQFEFSEVSDEIYSYQYLEEGHHIIPKYYEMFKDLSSDVNIYVKSNQEKENVLTIGMEELREKNIIVANTKN